MAERKIKFLDDTDHVRKRPKRYLGENPRTTGVREILDNAVDEVVRGNIHGNADAADEVDLIFHPDGSVEVRDNGRGLPAPTFYDEREANGIVATVGTSKAGENFTDDTTTAGTNGEGAAACNYISQRFDVAAFVDGKAYYQSFCKGRPGHFDGDDFDVNAAFTRRDGEKLTAHPLPDGAPEHGTWIRLAFDETVTPDDELDVDDLVSRARMMAWLTPNLTLRITRGGQTETVSSGESTGAAAVLDKLHGVTPLAEFCDSFTYTPAGKPAKTVDYDVAFMPVPVTDVRSTSAVNAILTADGGTHLDAAVKALGAAGASRNLRGLQRATGEPYPDAEDFASCLSLVVSVRTPAPGFTSQDKRKVKETRAFANALTREVERAATVWAASSANTKLLMVWAEQALAAARTKRKVLAAREEAKKSSGSARPGSNLAMPDKATMCDLSGVDSGAELFICEGLSAATTVIASRYAKFQAVYPLRGKPVKSWGRNLATLRKNQEFSDIETLLGCGVRDNCDPQKSRFTRIILIADADTDGYNINFSVMSMFLSNYRPLVEAGMLFIARPPLYILTTNVKDERIYAVTDDDRDEARERLAKMGRTKIVSQRCKGLGEMNPPDFNQTVMNPHTRVLKPVVIGEAGDAEATLDVVLGPSAEKRREWIAATAQRRGIGVADIMDEE